MLPAPAIPTPSFDPPAWYGPAVATFEAEMAGNPYDPEENDVRVRFVGENGRHYERIAFFDGPSTWKAVLVAPEPGVYRAFLHRNGERQSVEPKETLLELKARLPRGFLRVDRDHANRFVWDNGEPYYPVGINLGWQVGDGMLAMNEQIEKLSRSGITWTRVWASSWDGKNPFWPAGDPATPTDRLWEPALRRWDGIFATCEKSGVAVQMVLHNHGTWSSVVNANWPGHPWNEANGGFLRRASDFFTHREARRRTKMFLRHVVARHAHSPSLFAWELFNEVEFTDAALARRSSQIVAWHEEMAKYLRSIDPYDHPVTTSSLRAPSGVWKTVDFSQAHIYADRIGNAIARVSPPRGSPMFVGEFGHGKIGLYPSRKILREGLYAGMLQNHAAPPMYWFWDLVEKDDLYRELEIAAEVIRRSDIARHPSATPRRVLVQPSAEARALGESGWLTVRITPRGAGFYRVSGAGLDDGVYERTTIDLATGEVTTGSAEVEHAGFGVDLSSTDVVVVLARGSA
ncbi:hypothetical protein [Polyangium aurulentum]|uniref:hypothetical protein n=1 Tax=Polyangium aurulentum TaxID=2567896 RepID=UPI0010AE060D|nr:hypothetical protein [Polyangium aurulentum]UQA62040.1 hypothetical protein E8A73_016810 [Polyangium aurulentum]